MRTPIIPRTVFEFSQSSGGSAVATIPLATRVDATRCVSGCVYVRLHSKSWTSGTAAFSVLVKNASYTCDEPDVAYLESTPVATVSVGVGDSAPSLYVEQLATPIADQLQVVLSWANGTDTTTRTFAISVELELRDS